MVAKFLKGLVKKNNNDQGVISTPSSSFSTRPRPSAQAYSAKTPFVPAQQPLYESPPVYTAPVTAPGAGGPPVRSEAPAPLPFKPSLIVGIDFGTTSSGVAYAWVTSPDAKETTISQWPGTGNTTKIKIPSVMYYNKAGEVVGWGADTQNALNPGGFTKPDVLKVVWFKLLLERNYNIYTDQVRDVRLPPGKSEIDVAADFLSRVRETMRSELIRTLGDIFTAQEDNIKYFLTVPAVWSDAGKSATREAAVRAGFVHDINDRRLSLITEPEAAAIFCAKRNVTDLKQDDVFLIVDCGGGTVDLIAYEVEEENPFTVHECTTGTGSAVGSTLVDSNFMKIVNSKLQMMLQAGIIDKKKEDKIRRRCRLDFESIKFSFANKPEVSHSIDTGLSEDYPPANFFEGTLTFTNEEIYAAFENSVNSVVGLVKDQIAAIAAQQKRLKAILVVGGYGDSNFLYETLRNQVPPAFHKKVFRPTDSVAAIVKGAVVTGIYERVLTSRVARKHYLMATIETFKPGIHREEYRVRALDGGFRCQNTRRVFVQKGQRLSLGEQITVQFFRQISVESPRIFDDTLYTCEDDECPMYTTDPRIKTLVTLSTDLSSVPVSEFEEVIGPDGVRSYKIYFDVVVTLDGGNELRADFLFKNKVRGQVRCRF